jgi:hypothetical protein
MPDAAKRGKASSQQMPDAAKRGKASSPGRVKRVRRGSLTGMTSFKFAYVRESEPVAANLRFAD